MAQKRPLREVVFLGAGLYRYSIYPEIPFVTMVAEACQNALRDASVPWQDIEVGYCASAHLAHSAGCLLDGRHLPGNPHNINSLCGQIQSH